MTLKGILNDLAELQKKTDGLLDLEKKIKRKFKQMTSNESIDYLKQLEMFYK
jgi:hypothetical protein